MEKYDVVDINKPAMVVGNVNHKMILVGQMEFI